MSKTGRQRMAKKKTEEWTLENFDLTGVREILEERVRESLRASPGGVIFDPPPIDFKTLEDHLFERIWERVKKRLDEQT